MKILFESLCFSCKTELVPVKFLYNYYYEFFVFGRDPKSTDGGQWRQILGLAALPLEFSYAFISTDCHILCLHCKKLKYAEHVYGANY